MSDPPIRFPLDGPAELSRLILRGINTQHYTASEQPFKHHHWGTDELSLILSHQGLAQIVIEVDGQPVSLDLEVGSCLLVFESQIRTFHFPEQWGTHWYNFRYDQPAALPIAQKMKALEASDRQRYLDQILDAAQSGSVWTRRSAAVTFLDMLVRILTENDCAMLPGDPAAPIERVAELMRSNLHRVVTVEEMAELAGVSVSTFRSRFKLVFGESYKEFYDKMRVDAGFDLLVQGLSAGEVAKRLGYSDQFHFTRAYRRVMGRSPREIKRYYGPNSSGTKPKS